MGGYFLENYFLYFFTDLRVGDTIHSLYLQEI